MDILVVDAGLPSRVAGMIAATRAPMITSTAVDSAAALPKPYVKTPRGVIFGLYPVVDFLLHRMTEPPLLDVDPVKRGMQWTIFHALIDRDGPTLLLGDDETITRWLSELDHVLKFGKFYTGEQLTICDMAVCCLLDYLEQARGVTSARGAQFTKRCHAEIRKHQEANLSDD